MCRPPVISCTSALALAGLMSSGQSASRVSGVVGSLSAPATLTATRADRLRARGFRVAGIRPFEKGDPGMVARRLAVVDGLRRVPDFEAVDAIWSWRPAVPALRAVHGRRLKRPFTDRPALLIRSFWRRQSSIYLMSPVSSIAFKKAVIDRGTRLRSLALPVCGTIGEKPQP